MTSSSLSTASALEAMWEIESLMATGDSSLSSRASLICRGIAQLDTASQLLWVDRAANCFKELADKNRMSHGLLHDPMLADRYGDVKDHERKPSIEVFHILLDLVRIIAEYSAPETILSVIEKLPTPVLADQPYNLTPAMAAQKIFDRSLVRMVELKAIPSIVGCLSHGAHISHYSVIEILGEDGAIFDHPIVARATQKTLFLEYTGQLSGKGSLPFSGLPGPGSHIGRWPKKYYTCSNPHWSEILLSIFDQPIPTRHDYEHLLSFMSTAIHVSKMDQAYADKKLAAYPKSRQNITIPVFTTQERDSAKNKAEQAHNARVGMLQRMAKHDPAGCARVLLDHSNPDHFVMDWQNIGLGMVNAADFLLTKDISQHKRQYSVWPQSNKDEVCQALSGVMLSAADCLFLTYFHKETIEAMSPIFAELAEAGHPFSEGLTTVLGSNLFRSGRVNEIDSLWLASFSGNQKPSADHKTLRI